MLKLFILAAILAIASARPGLFHGAHHLVKSKIIKAAPVFHTQHILQKAIISEPTQIAVHEPYLTKVGEHVETIPTSYSHVYRSDVHSKTIVKDIVQPVVKSYIEPVVKHVEVKPIVEKAIISEPTHVAVQESYLTKVGEHVETVPTAVSHVYRSDVHSKALVKDIIAPVVKTYIQPVVKHIEVKPIVAEASVIIEEPKLKEEIHIEHAAATAETVIPHEISHEAAAGSIVVASASAVVDTPVAEYGAPKLSAEAFTTDVVKTPVVHTKAHAIAESVPFTSYEAPLGTVHAEAKASTISVAPASEYGLPKLSSTIKTEAFASASVNAPYPAKI